MRKVRDFHRETANTILTDSWYSLRMTKHLPRHIVWSTDKLDLRDPFQKRWLLRQTLMHGTAQDIRVLDFDEIKKQLADLKLPEDIDSLWRRYLESMDVEKTTN